MFKHHLFNRFLKSLTRLVTNDPIFKHRPLNAVTYNALGKHGKIKQIHVTKDTVGNCNGHVSVNNKNIPIVVEGSSLRFGSPPYVIFDISQQTEIEHFLNTVNS